MTTTIDSRVGQLVGDVREHLEAVRDEGKAEGYEEGRAAGDAQGRAELQVALDALTARAEAAERALADHMATVHRPPMVYGMNVSPGDTFTRPAHETAAQQADRIRATYGLLPALKYFYRGTLPTKFTAATEGQAATAFVSFKHDQAAIARGAIDKALASYAASIPLGYRVVLLNWQEPDDEMWKDKIFTADQHRAASQRIAAVLHDTEAYAAGRVRLGECFMVYSLEVGRFRDDAVADGVDVITWDKYWNTPKDGKADPAVALDQARAVNERLGKGAPALLETGDRRPGHRGKDGQLQAQTFATGADRAAFWARAFDHADATGWSHVLWFNAIGETGDHRLIPGEQYSEPTIDLLAARMRA